MKVLRALFIWEINGWLGVMFAAQGYLPELLIIGGLIVLMIYLPVNRWSLRV